MRVRSFSAQLVFLIFVTTVCPVSLYAAVGAAQSDLHVRRLE